MQITVSGYYQLTIEMPYARCFNGELIIACCNMSTRYQMKFQIYRAPIAYALSNF